MTVFDDLSDAFASADIGQHPAEWHGFLCGAAAGTNRPSSNLLALVSEDLVADHTSTEVLNTLIKENTQRAVEALNSEDFNFQLLLPGDEWPLTDRVEALAAWCQGYLSGLGQSGMAEQALSEENTSAIRDIEAIGQASSELQGLESEEQDYVELVEYLRVAVLLIHSELGRLEAAVTARPDDSQKTVH